MIFITHPMLKFMQEHQVASAYKIFLTLRVKLLKVNTQDNSDHSQHLHLTSPHHLPYFSYNFCPENLEFNQIASSNLYFLFVWSRFFLIMHSQWREIPFWWILRVLKDKTAHWIMPVFNFLNKYQISPQPFGP